MTISSDLFKAILSMDSYNRGYNASIDGISGDVGDATLGIDSSELGTTTINGEDIRNDALIGFYALSYNYNGETIIAYRGTDDRDEATQIDENTGWPIGLGSVGALQANMAFAFYNSIAELLNTQGAQNNIYLDANISLTGHSMGGGLAANDNFSMQRIAA